MRAKGTSWMTVALALGVSSLVAGCAGGSQGAAEGQLEQPPETVPGEVLVGVRAGAVGSPALEARIAAVGSVLSSSESQSFYRVHLADGVTEEAARVALADPDVVYVEPNFVVNGYATPGDALYADGSQPGAYSAAFKASFEIALASQWASSATTTPIVVAVLDTGVQEDHDDLAGTLASGGYNFVAKSTDVADDHGHGTQVTGIVAALADGTRGVLGAAGSAAQAHAVKVLPVKVLDASNKGNHAAVAHGIQFAMDAGAKVILVSFGSSAPSWTLQNAIQRAWAAGRLVVAAAGNGHTSMMRWPGAYQASNQGVVSVASVDRNDTLAADSNYGSWTDVAAPGVGLSTTLWDPDGLSTSLYTDARGQAPTTVSGTSYAAAMVAGEAALLWAVNPDLTVSQVRNLVTGCVDTYTRPAGRGLVAGGGRVNFARAALYATAPSAVRVGGVILSALSGKGGSTLSGFVVLSGPAPHGGQVVSLSSSDETVATVAPASVTVPENARTAAFSVRLARVDAGKTTDIGARLGTDAKAAAEVSETVTVAGAQVSKLTCQPASVLSGGKVTCTITLDSAAPSSLSVTVTSSKPQVTAPSTSVTVTGSSGTFQLSTSNTTGSTVTADVTAQMGSSSATARVSVVPAALTMTLSPTTVSGGGTVRGTLRLNGPAPAKIDVTVASSDPSAVPAPGQPITIAAGQTSAQFTLVAAAPDSTRTTAISATATGYVIAPQNVTVQGIAVSTLTLDAATLMENGTITGTVTLSKVPTTPVAVALVATSDVVALSASRLVLNGTARGTFTITTSEPLARTQVMVSASTAGTTARSASFAILPTLAGVAVLDASARPVTALAAGGTADVVVTLNAAAPATTRITLAASFADAKDASGMLAATSVDIGQGRTSGKVVLTGGQTGGTITITATTANGGQARTTITYAAPALSTLAVDQLTIGPGGTAGLTATLTGNALGSTAVDLTYSAPGALAGTPPTAITIAGGTRSNAVPVTFSAPSTVTTATTVVVTATLGAVTKTATVKIVPTSFASLVGPTTVAPGTTDTSAVVTLSGSAPSGGVVCGASSGMASVADVAAPTTTVAAGATTAHVSVAGKLAGTATISVTCLGTTRSFDVTVQ